MIGIFPLVFSRNSRLRLACFGMLVLYMLALPASAVQRMVLELDHVETPALQLQAVSVQLEVSNRPALYIRIGQLGIADYRWQNVTLTCRYLHLLNLQHYDCAQAKLLIGGQTIPLALDLNLERQFLQMNFSLTGKDRWQVHADWRGRDVAVDASMQNVDLTRLDRLMPLPVKISEGRLSGQIQLQQGTKITGVMQVQGLSFSNAEGSQAASKLDWDIRASLQQQAKGWDWQLSANWQAGELYWQPWYFAQGGHALTAQGRWDDKGLELHPMRISLNQIGVMQLAGRMAWADRVWKNLTIQAPDLNAGQAYIQLLKPWAVGGLLADMTVDGRVDASVNLANDQVQAFEVVLRDVNLADRQGRFALAHVFAQVPWSQDQPTQAELRYDHGNLLKIPLHATQVKAGLYGYSLTAPQIRLPLLDGALTLDQVSATLIHGAWHWHVMPGVSEVSLGALSQALGWKSMSGKISAQVPMVTYSERNLRVDGQVVFDVFDGKVTMTDVQMNAPLGAAVRLHANLEIARLNLGALTQVFSFGKVEGFLDGKIHDLALVNGTPASFDAAFFSSPGKYRKKISQRAVENISALGGAGAAAAIQRSFLRFFEQFNYEQIGLSCKLSNGVCEMNGIRQTPAGYVIVEGRSVPAITVLGYNHQVDWEELLRRLQRITQADVQAMVQ